MGNLDSARWYYDKALAGVVHVGDKYTIPTILLSLGALVIRQDSTDEAIHYFERALELSEETENKRSKAISIHLSAQGQLGWSGYNSSFSELRTSL